MPELKFSTNFQHSDTYLELIQSIFDTNSLLFSTVNEKVIKDYYKYSDIGYKLFHSEAGAIHLALNFDGVFHKQGFYEQAEIIHRFCTNTPTIRKIVELGCGKGFNISYLAKKNAHSTFHGMDITPHFVESAKRRDKQISNLVYSVTDYQDLTAQQKRLDMVYAIETLCIAPNITKVFEEVSKMLCKDGYFIVFDGFRQPHFKQLSQNIQYQAKLVEITTALPNLQQIDDWLALAKKQGFEVIYLSNLSQAVMPNLLKLQKLSLKYFKFSLIAKLLSKILPKALAQNAVAGLLLHNTFTHDAHAYYQIILKKL